MKLTSKRIRLALRSPSNLLWAARHVVRNTPLGQIDRYIPGGYSFKPTLISINITGRCNLRCEMCMQPRKSAGDSASSTVGGGRDELTPAQWLGVVDQAAGVRPAFYFSGGEPLLYQGLDEILARIKQRGMIAALVTNGTALTQYAERLVRLGVDNVTVSLDGPEEVHDKIRGVRGTFRRATEGIRALRQARQRTGLRFPAIKINCVITPTSLETLEETLEITKNLGVEEVNFQHPIFDSAENVAAHNRVFEKAFPGNTLGEDRRERPGLSAESKRAGEYYEMVLSEDQFQRLDAILRGILSRSDRHPKVLLFPTVRQKDWRGYYLNLAHPFERTCSAPWTMMRLLADGTFEPCLHYAVGNVTEIPLWQLWNSPAMHRFRGALLRHRLYPGCVRCCYRRY